jgi:hypothetical protein
MKQYKFLIFTASTLLISILGLRAMAGDLNDKLKPIVNCSFDTAKGSYSGDKLFTTDPLVIMRVNSDVKSPFHVVDAVAVKAADDSIFTRTRMEFKGTYTQSIFRNKTKKNEMIVLQMNGFPMNQDFEARVLLLSVNGNGSAQTVSMKCKLLSH